MQKRQTGKEEQVKKSFFADERVKVVLPAVLVVLGWFAGSQFEAHRDRINKRRELRLEYLLESYRTLERTASRPEEAGREKQDNVENALGDVQLLGTKDQMIALHRFIRDFNAAGGRGNISPFLEILRRDLREELGLSNDVPRATLVRFTNRFTAKQDHPSKTEARGSAAPGTS